MAISCRSELKGVGWLITRTDGSTQDFPREMAVPPSSSDADVVSDGIAFSQLEVTARRKSPGWQLFS